VIETAKTIDPIVKVDEFSSVNLSMSILGMVHSNEYVTGDAAIVPPNKTKLTGAPPPTRAVRCLPRAMKSHENHDASNLLHRVRSKRDSNIRKESAMSHHESAQAIGQSHTQRRTARAEAKITVQSSEAKSYDQTVSPALMEIRLSETFNGDIDGESTVRALQVLRDDQSAGLVSVQRFRGKLGGRHGTFVLQGSEIIENGKIKATWFVVPGSGTGDLSGLRGEGGFEGHFGKGSDGTLDYWFE
jgi:Protein of unknown function (DUF3224)